MEYKIKYKDGKSKISKLGLIRLFICYLKEYIKRKDFEKYSKDTILFYSKLKY